jgi:hypothetical protein
LKKGDEGGFLRFHGHFGIAFKRLPVAQNESALSGSRFFQASTSGGGHDFCNLAEMWGRAPVPPE